MKFEFIHHIINEDGNRIEWWAFDDVHLIVLPYYKNNFPKFDKARISYTNGGDVKPFLAKKILRKLELHMINQYKQQQHEQQI